MIFKELPIGTKFWIDSPSSGICQFKKLSDKEEFMNCQWVSEDKDNGMSCHISDTCPVYMSKEEALNGNIPVIKIITNSHDVLRRDLGRNQVFKYNKQLSRDNNYLVAVAGPLGYYYDYDPKLGRVTLATENATVQIFGNLSINS